jgi:hypothetical protein
MIMSKGMKAVRAKGVTGLAWANLAIASLGGAIAVDTWMGQLVGRILQASPWPWLPPVLLAGLVIAVGLDLFLDGVPNQVAIAGALLAPSVAGSTPGRLGSTVTDWSGALLDWMSSPLQQWVGTSSSTGLAVACIVASVLMARRVVRKSKGKSAAAVA